MQITLNGEIRDVPDGRFAVLDALRLLDLDETARGIAVAVDGGVVPRGAWARTPLAHGQRVEILTAVQGG
jgi:sulfur carrier protein